MRAGWAWIACAAAGCGFKASPGGTAIDGSDVDPRIDAYVPDAQLVDAFAFDVIPTLCYGSSGSFRICLPSMPTAPRQLAGTIDTTACTGGLVLAFGMPAPDLCVLSGTNVTASGVVRVIGGRPLVVVATQDVTIGSGATIDVSSIAAGTSGAGANLGGCNMGTGPGGDAGNAGGGAGGSFQSRGGSGGGAPGFNGGTSGQTMTATFVRGGCRGQNGAGTSPGSGGNSGGTIYLVAGVKLQIDGRINASGAGGRGAIGRKSGGGGGGSGGMIALYGGPIVIGAGAQLWANGGGGGGGGSSNGTGTNGGEAADPASSGGSGGGDGNGGVGSIQASDGSPGTAGGKGGGGGGGGAGVIENVIGGVLSPGEFSPPAI